MKTIMKSVKEMASNGSGINNINETSEEEDENNSNKQWQRKMK
jgi:hypothetical protein